MRDNGGMPTASPTVNTKLSIGPHAVQPPVVLAPMAGITNAPFRTLCREFSGGKGLFVSEMITTLGRWSSATRRPCS
ncbi:tRNA-dihydrouridine synthase B [Streptomyces tendae]